MDSNEVELTREQLYDELWKEPAIKVAAKYGISGTALAKICRKLSVPVPPRGYWALLAVGQAGKRPPLRRVPPGSPLAHRLVKRSLNATTSISEAPVERLKIAVADKLVNPHSLVLIAEAQLRQRGLASKTGAAVSPGPAVACLDVAVSGGSLDRALRIMDALIKSAEERGHVVEVTMPDAWNQHADDRRSKTHIVIGEEKVSVRLEEAYDRLPNREPQPSGRLVLATTTYGGEGERKTWRDTRSQRIENRLGEFMEAAERIAAFGHARTLAWRRKEDEVLRQRHLESLLDDIHRRAERWDAAKRLTAYLDAVEATSPDAGNPESPSGAVVAWAREQMHLNQRAALDVSCLRLEPAPRANGPR